MSIPRALVVFMLAPALGCGTPSPTPACYDVDPHSPVVWSQITDPVTFLTVDYCGRGASEREGLSRNLTAYCEPRPAGGCVACAYDVDALDEKLRAGELDETPGLRDAVAVDGAEDLGAQVEAARARG